MRVTGRAAITAAMVLASAGCAAPPPPGAPDVPRITPVPTAYDCAGRTVRVAFEAGVAYVTLPDGAMKALPRQSERSGDTPARRVYSDGRLTLTQEAEGERTVRMATGLAAPVSCVPR